MVHLGVDSISAIHAQTANTGYRPLDTAPATAEQVTTGVYAVNVYSIDPSSNTYYVDFYTWFKWKGEIDPIANLEFTNGVEDWGMTRIDGYEKPEKLPDGNQYQVVRVEGRFVQPFVLTRYPLDDQRLTVIMENSVYPSNQLVYLPDQKDSGYAPELTLPGWKFEGFQVKSMLHEYNSKFGDPRPGATTYSALRSELEISRPVSFFVWKLLLPLLIVLVSSWGAHLLTPMYVDSRIIMPVTALLTTVFLQQSYSSALPDVGYLVLLDKIYALAYILIIAALMETIITADWIKNDGREAELKVKKVDRILLITQAATLVIGSIVIILTT
jgi:uncharacterized membrane protein